MKNFLFGLGILSALSFPMVGYAYGENEYEINPDFKYVFPTHDVYILESLFEDPVEHDTDFAKSNLIGSKKYNLLDIGKPQTTYFIDLLDSDEEERSEKNYFYPLSVEQMKNKTGYFGGEIMSENIDFLRYFHSLDHITVSSNGTDFRPLENSKKLTSLEIDGPIASFGFFKKLSTLEDLAINANGETDGEYDSSIHGFKTDKSVKAVTDVTFINELNKLNYFRFESDDRPFPTVSLKKSMNKYILVNPFILSKQFKNPTIQITSKTPGFIFEDDILTWNGISPDTKELQISWEFNSEENGNFKFSGNSIIPINWID